MQTLSSAPRFSPDAPQGPRHGWLGVMLGSFTLLAIVFSWLAFPHLVNGSDLLASSGDVVKEERRAHANTLTQYLTRGESFPGNIEVKVLYATEDYFAKSDRAGLTEFYEPSENYVFFRARRRAYRGSARWPAQSHVAGGWQVLAADLVECPEAARHHRLTILSFSKHDAAGRAYAASGETPVHLTLLHAWDLTPTVGDRTQPVMSAYVWPDTVVMPEEVLNAPAISGGVLVAVSVGLLSAVLTPCLLQLAFVFLATMGANGAEAITQSGGIDRSGQRRVMTTAVAFVVGYVVLFTAAGVLIGVAGKKAQIAFADYVRPISIGAGELVILFGLWLGIRSNAPALCRLPGAGLIQRMKTRGPMGSVLISIVHDLGCMSCFGGAIIATLFIYGGSLGSAWSGAVMMGGFALGVAVPFLLAALLFTRMEGLILAVAKHRRAVGLVSSLVIIGFGGLLVPDNFHTLSDAIYPCLGLN